MCNTEVIPYIKDIEQRNIPHFQQQIYKNANAFFMLPFVISTMMFFKKIDQLYQGAELLGHRVIPWVAFWRTAKLLSTVIAPFYQCIGFLWQVNKLSFVGH